MKNEIDDVVRCVTKIDKEKIIYLSSVKDESMLKYYDECERESYNVDFIKTERERSLYCRALFEAIIWGLNVNN